MWPFGLKTKNSKPASGPPAQIRPGIEVVRRTEIITEREWTSTVTRKAALIREGDAPGQALDAFPAVASPDEVRPAEDDAS